MVLGKLPVPRRPTFLDVSRARAYCACSRCGWGCLDIFTLLCLFSLLSPSRWETARYRLKYCLYSDVPHNTYVNLTDGNLAVFILPRSHARVIVVRRHGSVKSLYPLYLH